MNRKGATIFSETTTIIKVLVGAVIIFAIVVSISQGRFVAFP